MFINLIATNGKTIIVNIDTISFLIEEDDTVLVGVPGWALPMVVKKENAAHLLEIISEKAAT